MGLDIDAWSHLTPYTGPPCANTDICQMAPEYQTALIPPARALGHIRLHTGPKTADEIRKEFGLEPGVCYHLDPAYSGLAGTRRRPCLSSRRVIFGGLSLTSLLVR